MRRLLALVGALVLIAALAACGGREQTLTVYAAASLKGAFTQIADTFEADHPGVDVQLSFGGSSTLVAQIEQGAPVDVFASADTANMTKLVAAGLVTDGPTDFATNTLQIAVPAGNPAGITTLADLAKPGVTVVVCAPQVPCGAATQKVAQAAGLTFHPVSEEQSVTDVLTKVTSGEADAGLVYVTDVKAAGAAVVGIAFPEATQALNRYPIATMSDAALADEFVAAVLSQQGRDVLAARGFGAP